MIKTLITGMISNRVRGTDFDVYFLNQDDCNALLYAACFSQQWWHIPIHYLAMRVGSSTGWTEAVAAATDRYELTEHESLTWISKIVKITNQWTCFLWWAIRGLIWTLPLYLGFFATGVNAPLILLSSLLMYPCYRIMYLLFPKKDICATAEPIWGLVSWGIIYALTM